MERRALVFLAVIAFFLTAVACAPRTDIRRTEQIEDVLPPSFELVPGQTSIERFDPPGAGSVLEMTVGSLVRNDNQYPVKLESVTYDVYLEGRHAVRGAIVPDVYLEPGATAPLAFQVSTDLAGRNELFVAAARAFVDRPLEFRIEGTLRFTSASYAFETRSRELLSGSTFARRTAQAPLLSLDEESSRVYELSQGVPVAQVVLLANNPGDIGYFLHGKELTLMLGGWPVATEDMSPVPIAAGDTTRVDLIFYPSPATLNAESLTALQAAIEGYATLIRLEGELYMDVLGVDSFPVPGGWSVTGFVH